MVAIRAFRSGSTIQESDGVAIIADGREANSMTRIGKIHADFLKMRDLNVQTAADMGIYSGSQDQDGNVNPDINGKILVMPFIRGGKEVGAKYRGPNKTFWQKKGGEKVFFNSDVLDDLALTKGDAALVITEGELDAVAVASAGYPFVVSVPDGAPPARDGEGKLIDVPKGTDDIDPETDTKFSYLLGEWDRLAKIKRIIIAADGDEAGNRLAQELVRRLDRARCSFVTYPDGCKDANDVLRVLGSAGIHDLIQGAKPYPIDGLYKMDDFPDTGAIQTYSTGFPMLDDYVKPYLGCFMVVGGFPGHGKSTWTMQFAANMARMHKWNIAVASFEMQVVPYVTDAIMGAFFGGNIRYAAASTLLKAREFVNKRFTFIAPNRADFQTEHDIDWLIDKMQTAVVREGIKMVLIDPFNEIEHRKRSDESTTEYIGRAIRKLKSFAHEFNVLVCVVVHPTKAASSMDSEDLGLYNLADSSHWANKADIGIIVGRLGDPQFDTLTGIYVKKIRYQPDAGQLGSTTLNFDKSTRLFS
jgi:twinkle protein